MTRKALLTVASMWLAWVLLTLAFQELVPARLMVQPPDYALSWTPAETKPHSQDDKPYLNDPFLNTHVSWDSEFYLSIATTGYDDPRVRAIRVLPGRWVPVGPRAATPPLSDSPDNRPLSFNYAFMPFYLILMRLVAFPFNLLGLDAIAAATI